MTAERFRLGFLIVFITAIGISAHLARYDYIGEWVRADRWAGGTEVWSCIDPMDEPLRSYRPHRDGKYITYYDDKGMTLRGENVDCRWRAVLPIDIDLTASP